MTTLNKNKNIVRGVSRDVNIFPIDRDLPLPVVIVRCNVDGEYRLYSGADNYTSDILVAGTQYVGPFTKVLTSTGTLVPAKAISVRF